MYDYVNWEVNCPVCGELVTSFQTKDSHSILATVEPESIGNFYTICDNNKCEQWIEYVKESGEFRMTSPTKVEIDIIKKIKTNGDAIIQSRSKHESVSKYCHFYLLGKHNKE